MTKIKQKGRRVACGHLVKISKLYKQLASSVDGCLLLRCLSYRKQQKYLQRTMTISEMATYLLQ